MPQLATRRPGESDVDEHEDGEDVEGDVPAAAIEPSASISCADSHIDEISRNGKSINQVPMTNPPARAAMRTPMNPSRVRPVRAMRPLASSR